MDISNFPWFYKYLIWLWPVHLPEVVRCSHDSLTLHTGVEIDGVGESCPPKVQHLTNSWGIERLHRLFPGLRHLYHQVLFKGPGAGTCGEKNRNLHVRKLLILRAISSSWNQVSKIILHRSIEEYFGLSSHLKIRLTEWHSLILFVPIPFWFAAWSFFLWFLQSAGLTNVSLQLLHFLLPDLDWCFSKWP